MATDRWYRRGEAERRYGPWAREQERRGRGRYEEDDEAMDADYEPPRTEAAYGPGFRPRPRDYPYEWGSWREHDVGRYGSPPTRGPYGVHGEEDRPGMPPRYEDDRYGRREHPGSEFYGREREENYAGRGPTHYQRSDEKIYDDINDRLTDHPRIDASDIEVYVEAGVVTLKGTVRTREQKRLAEDVAEFTTGVKEVHNQIRVQSARMPERQPSVHGATTSVPGGQEARVLAGMAVVDVNGKRIGEIKEVRNDVFHLDRPMKRDLFVPLRAVREVVGNQVVLQYHADELDDLGWDSPELLGVGNKRK